MRAVQLIHAARPVEDRDVARPEPEPGELLLRVRAAGICHSDVHYRAGTSSTGPLPLTLGHESAGEVEAVGEGVQGWAVGDRVCVHYMATCGACHFCAGGTEQFCAEGRMIGKHRHGGWAEHLCIPARSAIRLHEAVPFEAGAVMMCSSATSLHALNKARLQPGETVAVYGVGGLGLSAVQIALELGAATVYAIDLNPKKLAMAESFGAAPIDAGPGDADTRVRAATGGRGVDVALELIGLPATMRQAVRSLAVFGRAALAGITDRTFDVAPYDELLNREAEIIGVSDHLAPELEQLVAWAAAGRLRLDSIVTDTVPLDATRINGVLDDLQRFGDAGRVVIVPG